MLNSLIVPYLPLLLVSGAAAMFLGLGHRLLLARRKDLGSEARLPRQLLLLVLTVLVLIVLIIVAPLPESTRNQILALLGLVLSGVVALSAAPFVTNFMAAVMLRVTRPFVVGDFIHIGGMYGKVSQRGLFDTEIQTENRELIAIPNATFITQPVTVVRSSGVIISTTISLGYDLGCSQVEPLMLKAAANAGLQDPYVHIIELQDSAVNYKVFGLLVDVETALTARSELNRQLLSTLHTAGLEIVSPSIARHITQSPDVPIIPIEKSTPRKGKTQDNSVKAEEIVFDKARDIERLRQERASLKEKISALQEDKASDKSVKESLQQSLAVIEDELKDAKAQR